MTEVTVTVQRPNRVLLTSRGPQGIRGPAGSAIVGSGGGVNVMDYGAVGDNVTDDTEAIQAAIDDAGRGEKVFFPRGNYIISAPIRPKRQQILEGVYATKYQAGEWPSFYADCAIIASPDFEGHGMIVCEPTAFGVHIDRLAIIGPGHDATDQGVSGIRMPDWEDNIGETAWLIRDCLINGCPDAGIKGRMWVIDLRDTHISNCGYGILVDGPNRINDARIIGCNIYFNVRGGIVLDGETRSGALEVIGTRVERSGNKYGYPGEPLDFNAPGILLRNVQNVSLVGCYTDACSGPGLEIGNEDPEDERRVYNVSVTSCTFSKDGGGDQGVTHWLGWSDEESTWVEVDEDDPSAYYPMNRDGHPGVLLRNCYEVRWTSNIIGYGKSFDGGDDVPGPITPTHGVWLENTINVEIYNSRIDVLPKENDIHLEGEDNFRFAANLPQQRVFTVPTVSSEQWLPEQPIRGMVAWQDDIQSLRVKSWGDTWRIFVNHDGVNPLRLPRQVDIRSDGTIDAAIRYMVDGTLAWAVGHNATAYGTTFYISRYDELGEYVDTPLSLVKDTGRIETKHQYVRNSTTGDYAILVRGALDQTVDLQRWQSDTTAGGLLSVAGVRKDGRIWASDATASDDLIPLGQVKSVVAASTDFADFKSRIAAL